MAATASTEFLLCLSFLHLLSGWSGAGRADTHCLCYDFIITPKFRPEPRWCEVQGLVDERPFLHYDCVNHKAKAFASLGKKVNVTKTWEKQTETLGDVVDFLKGQLPDIQVENLIHIEPLILQARMSCEHEAHGHGRGSWQFLFNGQTFLLFDSNNRKWTALHPGAKKMKEKWENRDVTMFFQKISMGDCKTWLQEFLMYWEQMLDPTSLFQSRFLFGKGSGVWPAGSRNSSVGSLQSRSGAAWPLHLGCQGQGHPWRKLRRGNLGESQDEGAVRALAHPIPKAAFPEKAARVPAVKVESEEWSMSGLRFRKGQAPWTHGIPGRVLGRCPCHSASFTLQILSQLMALPGAEWTQRGAELLLEFHAHH
ncbi:UL16-binding protein 1-like [Rhinopithecus roxellana]|uniref:UL16-binding protein 1-like n=1 Tax=Rhinopithecus roxellana TaxID=61622 RepID=UPI0012375197|nr:UL16-binding protein 1-like [Rhinopithecus roxellana]